jgi:hypothetical protein
MREYYRQIIFKVLFGIAIAVTIAIEYDYIQSLHGFYGFIVVLGFVFIWEKVTKHL